MFISFPLKKGTKGAGTRDSQFANFDPSLEFLLQQISLVQHQHQRRFGQQFVLADGGKQLKGVVDPVCSWILVQIL